MEEAKRKQLLEALEEMKKQLLGLSKEEWISTIRKQRNQARN